MTKPKIKSAIPIDIVISILDETYPTHPMGEITGGDPFKVLVACIMSLRTRDDVTMPLAEKFFKTVDTPEKMARLSVAEIEKHIYPVGFYKTKAQNIKEMSERIVDEYGGVVPDEIDELLKFKGVGRKTANLVVGLGYKKPAICVDVHVHRICNRLGYIQTKTPEETEMELRRKLPMAFWAIINRVMVRHGQEICKPVQPLCNQCPIEPYCLQVDVKTRHRKD